MKYEALKKYISSTYFKIKKRPFLKNFICRFRPKPKMKFCPFKVQLHR